MRPRKAMKPYRVTKVELMAPPTFFVSPNMIYEIVFRATPDDVTLKFDDTEVLKGFREMCLDSFEHLPSEGTGDVDFDRELAAISFGASLDTLGPRDRGCWIERSGIYPPPVRRNSSIR